MKKFTIALGFCIALVSVNVIAYPANWDYVKKDISTLKVHGYHDAVILYADSMYCDASKTTYDWDAAAFRAVSPKGHVVEGIVCGGQVYVRRTTV